MNLSDGEMKFQLESNVPLSGYNRVYPFDRMKVGDSFIATEPRKVRTALAMHCRRHPGSKFTTRKADGGVRIWRTA